jgi:predicted dehydrogenase
MKIAMVGLGYWGQKVMRNLVSLVGVESVIAVDPHLSALEAQKESYPGLEVALSLDAVCPRTDVGAVVIATPLESHYRLAKQALLAGKHVLVEKPMTGDVDEATELALLADQLDLRLMVGHTFLFSPRVELLAKYLHEGRLGKVHYMTSSRLNLGLVRHDADVVWDLAPHDFSILFHLLGETPCSVQTTARTVFGRLPEVAFVNLTFPSGIVAQVTVSWMAPRKVRDLVIVGEHRMAIFDDTNADEPIRIYDKGIEVQEGADFASNQLVYRFGDTVAPNVSAAEPLARQIAHFVDCCETGTTPRSDGWFGVRVVEALEAAHRSFASGGQPAEVRSVALR